MTRSWPVRPGPLPESVEVPWKEEPVAVRTTLPVSSTVSRLRVIVTWMVARIVAAGSVAAAARVSSRTTGSGPGGVDASEHDAVTATDAAMRIVRVGRGRV